MRLLILGALGPYPERISSFLADGHDLWYACTEAWLPRDRLPGVRAFNFKELGDSLESAAEGLTRLIAAEQIECVYSLLNVWDGGAQATAALLRRGCPAPVVRHYKEHYMTPWADERDSLELSAGAIFINEESRDYFAKCYRLPARTACLDADLIPSCYLAGELQPKLSASDGVPRLLIAGSASADGGRYDYRELIRELTNAGAEVHLYGQFRRLEAGGQLHDAADVRAAYQGLVTSGRLRLHDPVPPERFVAEWSCFDAGLLHVPRADDPFRALNLPNRYSAYLAVGLPVAVQAGAMPAMQRRLEELGAAIVYEQASDLAKLLPDRAASKRALRAREAVTFEAVYPRLIGFIRSCL